MKKVIKFAILFGILNACMPVEVELIKQDDSKLTIGVKEYRNLTGCYIAATKRINKENSTFYLPYQIQAITWCTWRRLHGIK